MAGPENDHEGPPLLGTTDGPPGLPRIWHLWQEGQGNPHALILGVSGPAKTTSILTLLLRLAATADTPTQVVGSAPLGTPAAPKKGG
ncbi:MAG: hypothetical protein H0X37_21380 [Herpetosiphonaceae bacterium]|nr:hypothetical protein [Herpetosiphonaceae bacterium]